MDNFFARKNITDRLRGLDYLFDRMEGQTVLDVGCAEGVISEICYTSGAESVYGVDVRPEAVVNARKNCPRGTFSNVDVRHWTPPDKYDIVLFLGVYHHLPDSHSSTLQKFVKTARKYFAIRTPKHPDIPELNLVHEVAGFDEPKGGPGTIRIYEVPIK